MRVDSTYNSKIILDSFSNLRVGSIINGKILAILEDKVNIRLSDGNVIIAELEDNVEFKENDIISLKVNENSKDKVILSLMKSAKDELAIDKILYGKSTDLTSIINKYLIKHSTGLNNNEFGKVFDSFNNIMKIMNISKNQIINTNTNTDPFLITLPP